MNKKIQKSVELAPIPVRTAKIRLFHTWAVHKVATDNVNDHLKTAPENERTQRKRNE